MMKSIKRGMAVLLSVLLMVPAQPVMAAESVSAGLVEKNAVKNEAAAENETQEDSGKTISEKKQIVTEQQKASSSNADTPSDTVDPSDTAEKASPDSAKKPEKKAEDEVIFNTGNYGFHVVSKDDFFEKELGDGYFEDDGSYVIEIPEANPFFPYEVQFTHDGETASEWFMSPEDTVEVGGHRFSVSAYFDNTVVTQMTLNIAGESVVVYPEKKEFTNREVMPMSLLPLEERRLAVDLSGFTPVELTMVSLEQMFTGTEALESTDKVVWKYRSGKDDYSISSSGGVIDLSRHSTYGYSQWEMIVGSDDQLDESNIRYMVDVTTTDSEGWLIPKVYTEDEAGSRKNINVAHYSHYDNAYNNGYLAFYVSSKELEFGKESYVGLELDSSLFPSPNYDHLKVYEGRYKSAAEAMAGTEITDKIFSTDMNAAGAGYLMPRSQVQSITIVAFDSTDQVTGCMTFDLRLRRQGNYLSASLITSTQYGWTNVYRSEESTYENGCETITYMLKHEYPVDGQYRLVMNYSQTGIDSNSKITSAYKGKYSSIAEAKGAQSADLKDVLFSGEHDTGGYEADYSKGIYFTIFVGEDGAADQEVYHLQIKTEEGAFEPGLSGNTYVSFDGLKDKEGKTIPAYVVEEREDSYGEYNFPTILVGEDVDLTAVAPTFDVAKGLKLYTAGSSSPEVSGVSAHDFSNGPVQYTASAENGEVSKNYWLQIAKASAREGQLYINSLAAEDAETKTENGVIYSTREVFLDGYHDDVHDILLANMSLKEIPALSVELVSDEVELDEYWTLKGVRQLDGFTNIQKTTNYGELFNLAKIRLNQKDGVDSGNDVNGTLTIKSAGVELIVLTLTGTVGDPSITTKEIPPAVKYVPYGTMIQNSNKYSWNNISYRIEDGTLPAGMIVKPNGEIYGVPTETGEFTFTVVMENSSDEFSDSRMTYTLIVEENTDLNVENATDEGYHLTQRINDLRLNSSESQTLVSQGTYAEFVDIYLDGVKLKAGEDYTSESGSTRITIRNQTLKAANQTGTHTLGIEFRTKDTDTLKRAAQNYKVENKSSGGGGGSSSSGSSSGTSAKKVTGDSKRGITDSLKGIITGEGAGYCRWQQDEKGWKLIYADGTFACGSAIGQTDGSSVVQPAWEKVNGAWYAFGSDGYLMTGWVFDYQLNAWYYMTIDNGMKTGWYYDDQDHCTYYLDAETGAITTGWKQIDGNWYYFTDTSAAPTWNFNGEQGAWVYDLRSKHKPYGSMYHNERTPDGYYVEENGVWRN